MAKPWIGTGLADHKSWLGTTHGNDGLAYRGDSDFEQLGPGGKITLLEFKNAGENMGLGQMNWLRRRARDPLTEVRVIREIVGTDPTNPDRPVMVWDPRVPGGSVLQPLSDVAAWVNSRAYRSGKELDTNLPDRPKKK